MNNEAITARIMREAADRKLPQYYQIDLETDRTDLANAPDGSPFVWVLRKCGTFIVFPAAGKDGERAIHWLRGIMHNWQNERYYIAYSNGLLRQVEPSRALTWLVVQVEKLTRLERMKGQYDDPKVEAHPVLGDL